MTLPSGLQYKILESGSGKFHPTVDSPCECHYEGRTASNYPSGPKFDSSYDRGSPTTFAPNQVIKVASYASNASTSRLAWLRSAPPAPDSPVPLLCLRVDRGFTPNPHPYPEPLTLTLTRTPTPTPYPYPVPLPPPGVDRGDAADGRGRQVGAVHPLGQG